MPWNSQQHRLFEIAANNPQVARKVGIPQQTAQKMASEGVKKGQMMADQIRKGHK